MRSMVAHGPVEGPPSPFFFDIEAGYWAERKRSNVLLVHYADLSADLELEMRRIADFQLRKREMQLDAWGRRPAKEIESLLNPLVDWIDRVAPESKAQYPTPWATEKRARFQFRGQTPIDPRIEIVDID